MINKYLLAALGYIVLVLVSFSSLAFDVIDESVVFPSVAQGHHGSNNNLCHQITGYQLSINGTGKINGTGGASLDYCSVNDGSGLSFQSCDDSVGGDRKCTIDGTDIRGLKMSGSNRFLYSNGVNGLGYCKNGDQLSLGFDGQSQFGSVSLYSQCTLTLSASQSEYRFANIAMGNGAKLIIPAGDYWIENLQLNQNAELILQGNARLFIGNSSELNGAKVNEANGAALTIVAYDDFTLNSGTLLNGKLYSDDIVTVNGLSTINGAVTSRYLRMNGGTINAGIKAASSQLQFGKATSTNVVFDTPFESGVTPLIFVMPMIDGNDPQNDGPASVFVTQVTSSGFTWQQRQPVGSRQISQQMTEVHWIAVTAGEHQLSDGSYIEAGTVNVSTPSYGNSENYQQVSMSRPYDVVLNQIQSTQNNCWLTSTAKWNNSSISVGIDVSEAVNAGSGNGFGNKRCQPENIQLNKLNAERVAYLALKTGNGIIELGGKNVRYQFGSDAQTINLNSTVDLAIQCNYLTSLIGFENEPTVVAGKHSRNGNNGGWLRRCQLTNTQVSMVTDEDQYQDSERNHIAEIYGFVALEVIDDTPQLGCFKDDFNRQDLGSDWAIKTLGSSVPPAINSQRMRITPASGNQATSSTFQRLFPAENNLVQVEFDYFAWSPSSGTGGDGVAIILSDAAITPQPGSFGGSLGYAQRDDGTPGFAGGWIGIGLDEYGNFSNPNEGKRGGPGFRQQAVAIRGSNNSGYMYLAGTRANISPTIDARGTNSAKPNHRYRITVDSRQADKALVLVERDIKDGNGFQVLVPQFDARNINGQGGVPADFYLSITGSTGGANNNHEIDNFEVCALDSRPVGQQVHHFEFDYSSNPLTCNPESMTIRACRNAQCDLFTDPVTATLLPANMTNGGWVGGNIVTISNGIGTVSLRSNTTAPVTIGVSSSSPSTIAGSNTLCRKGSGDLDIASCTLSFAESGFVFDVPDELSNKPSTNILVKAVKKDGESLQCVPAFTGGKTVDFWSDYITPNNGFLPVKVTVAGIESPVGKSVDKAKELTLSFDDKGQAIIDVNYADAGEMQLNARYIGSGDEQGLVMNGSNKFVRRPVGLCIDSEVCSDCSVSGPVYKKAGEEFDMTVKAMAWESDSDGDICSGNALTPNFTLKGIALTHELVLPTIADGGAKGSLGLDEYEQKSGRQTVKQSVSEVGVFKFSVIPKPNSYFGYSIPGATSGKMGRFTPYYLTATPVEPSLQSACGSFTYMDQPFGFKPGLEPRLLVIGKDKQGNETKNYQIGDWWKYSNNWDKRIFSNTAGSSLPPLAEVNAGEVRYLPGNSNIARSAYLLNSSLSYNRSPTPIAPFDALLELQLSSDDVKDSDNICYQTNASTSCSGINFDDIGLNDEVQLRYGRMVLDNGYGPESESLRLPLRAEYVSSVAPTGEATWVTNNLDNCSIYNTQTSADASEVSTTGLYMQPPTGFPELNGYTSSGLTLQNTQLRLGNGFIYFSIPNKTGEVPLKQHVEPWLKWFWDYDGVSPSNLYDPRASAYFGTYRGHDKVIFWREVH